MGYYKRLMIEAMQPKEEPPMEVLLPKGYEMTITPQPWIPVSARLPEEERDVVVFTNEGTHVAAMDEDGIWCPSHGDGWMFPEVTHWMPLPEPPELPKKAMLVHKDCTLTTESLSCDTSVSIPVSERLSQNGDYPAPDNRASEDNVGSELVQDATNTLTDAERAAVERAIETLDGFQRTGGYHSAVDDDAATLWGLLGRMA